MQLIAHLFFPYFLEKRLAIATSPFFTFSVTCLPPFFNLNEKYKYCCLNHCHNTCTIDEKDTKLTSLFLQVSSSSLIHKDPSIGAQI